MNQEQLLSLISGLPSDDILYLINWHNLTQHFNDRATSPELGPSTTDLEQQAAWLLIYRLSAQKMGGGGPDDLIKRCDSILDVERAAVLIRRLNGIRTEKRPGDLSADEYADWQKLYFSADAIQAEQLYHLQCAYFGFLENHPHPNLRNLMRGAEDGMRRRRHGKGIYSIYKWNILPSEIRSEYWHVFVRGYLFRRLGLLTHVDISDLGDCGSVPPHISALVCEELLRFEVACLKNSDLRLLSQDEADIGSNKIVSGSNITDAIDEAGVPTKCVEGASDRVRSNNSRLANDDVTPTLKIDTKDGYVEFGQNKIRSRKKIALRVLDELNRHPNQTCDVEHLMRTVWKGSKVSRSAVDKAVDAARGLLIEVGCGWKIEPRHGYGWELVRT